MTRPAWLAAVADELGTDVDSWRETACGVWCWCDGAGTTWTAAVDSPPGSQACSVGVDGGMSVWVTVLCEPAHMPRLVRAVRAAVGIARARFCVWCSGTESHKMSCSALMTGHVGEHEPCQERDLRALAGPG